MGGLQREIGKKRPFDSTVEETMLNLLRTHDRFQLRFARLFRGHGLTSSQYNVLRTLRGEGRPMPCLEIADRMVAAVPAITGLIDRLEALGLATRERSTRDRRVVYVTITASGLELLKALDQPVKDLHQTLIGHLSPDELRELGRLLEKARLSAADEEG
jgi:DNA-binding MarR family transcriptional regulator